MKRASKAFLRALEKMRERDREEAARAALEKLAPKAKRKAVGK